MVGLSRGLKPVVAEPVKMLSRADRSQSTLYSMQCFRRNKLGEEPIFTQ